MSTSIKRALNTAIRDGRVGKNDLKEVLKSAIDGKGVTKNEAATLKKIRDDNNDAFTPAARKAFDGFLAKMNRSWSSSKSVHLPNFDEGDLKELFESDPRLGIATGRTGGGESSRRSTSSRRTGGGESSSRRAPARRSGGGESSVSSYYTSRPSRPSYSRSYSYGGGE